MFLIVNVSKRVRLKMTIKVNDRENKLQIEHLEKIEQVDEVAIYDDDDWDVGFATLSVKEIEKLMEREFKSID